MTTLSPQRYLNRQTRTPHRATLFLSQKIDSYRRATTPQNIREVLDVVDYLILKFPRDFRIRHQAGNFFEATAREQKRHSLMRHAAAHYDRGLEIDPLNERLLMGSARAHYSIGSFSVADERMTRYLEINANAQSLQLAINIKLVRGKNDEADQLADQLQALHDDHIAAYTTIIRTRLASGRIREATELLEKRTIEERRHDRILSYLEAKALYYSQNYRRALEILTPKVQEEERQNAVAALFIACHQESGSTLSIFRAALGSDYDYIIGMAQNIRENAVAFAMEESRFYIGGGSIWDHNSTKPTGPVEILQMSEVPKPIRDEILEALYLKSLVPDPH